MWIGLFLEATAQLSCDSNARWWALYQWRLIGVAMLSEAQEVFGHLSRCAPLSWAAGGNLLTADWVDMCSVQCGVVSNISIDKSNFCATSTWEERTGKLMATIIIRKEITSNTFQLRFLFFHKHCTAPSPLLTYRMHPKLWGVKRTLAVFFLHLPSLAITTSTNVKYPTFLTFYLKCNSKSWLNLEIVWPYSSLYRELSFYSRWHFCFPFQLWHSDVKECNCFPASQIKGSWVPSWSEIKSEFN